VLETYPYSMLRHYLGEAGFEANQMGFYDIIVVGYSDDTRLMEVLERHGGWRQFKSFSNAKSLAQLENYVKETIRKAEKKAFENIRGELFKEADGDVPVTRKL